MRESVVSAKPLLLYGLARNRRGPKRPPEPRTSGVHPERGRSGIKMRSHTYVSQFIGSYWYIPRKWYTTKYPYAANQDKQAAYAGP